MVQRTGAEAVELVTSGQERDGLSYVAPEESSGSVLIADDDPLSLRSFSHFLESAGFELVVARDGEEAIGALSETIDVALFDLRMPKASGLTCLKHARQYFPETRVIIVSGAGEIEDAVAAMKQGAFEYVTKPVEREALVHRVQNAMRDARLVRDNQSLRAAIGTAVLTHTFIANTSSGKELLDRVGKVAMLDATVLITGESGTGKSTIARMIHSQGRRSQHPFVALNCASLPRDLIESELFGHAKGAFTGADCERAGKIEVANGGTLFLDEIGDLPLELQPKLLTFLQDRTCQRLGSNKVQTVDVRVIAASHQDLAAMCRENRFRQDLYFRVNVLPLRVPSLSERSADIPGLASTILDRIARQRGQFQIPIAGEAIDALQRHDWVGNVRELENILERASAFCESSTIGVEDLDFEQLSGCFASLAGRTLAELESQAIRNTLEANGGNKALAARQLGISEKSIYNKLRRLGISF